MDSSRALTLTLTLTTISTLTHHRRLLTQTLDALRTNTVSLFLLLTHSPSHPHPHHRRLLTQNNQIGEKGAQSIADALRTNTVSLFLLLTHISPSHPHSPSTPSHTDTHHTRSLEGNQIGEKGAQSIADALRTNTVSLFLLLTHSPSHPHSPSTPSHTDTHHTRSLEQSNRRERSPIHRRCLAHKHGQSLPPPHTLTISPSLTIDAFSHRHSPHSISSTIKSATKEPNPSPMPCAQTRSVSSSSSSHTHHLPLTHHRRLLTQTLTTLSLWNNQIGEKGAQSIADALRTNTVSLFLLLTHSPSHPHSPSTPSHTDTHHTRSRRQSNRRERSPIHRRCLAHKHGQSLPPPHTLTISPSLTIDAFSHRHSPHSSISHDTHHRQSNRRERSPIHRRCLAHKHGQSLPPPHTLTISPSLTTPSHPRRLLTQTLTTHRRLLTQTLTTLNLWNNQIGDKGAQSIADALRTNTVSLFLLLTHSPSHPHSPSTPSHTDTHHTRTRRQSNRR